MVQRADEVGYGVIGGPYVNILLIERKNDAGLLW